MTVISSKDFAINQEKYFDMALNEQIVVQRDDYMFHIRCSNFDTMIKEQAILEPDDDLRRAIPLEKVRDSIVDYIHKKHAKAI